MSEWLEHIGPIGQLTLLWLIAWASFVGVIGILTLCNKKP